MLASIADPNVPWKPRRRVTLTVDFTVNDVARVVALAPDATERLMRDRWVELRAGRLEDA